MARFTGTLQRKKIWNQSYHRGQLAAFCLSVHRFIWRRWEAGRKIIIMGKMQWRNLGTGTLSARSGLLCSGRRLVASGSSAWVRLLSVLRRCTMSGINCVWIHRCWMYHKHGDPCSTHLKTFFFLTTSLSVNLVSKVVFFLPNQASAFFCGFPLCNSASWLMAQISQSCHRKRRHLGLIVTYCNKICFMIVFWQSKTVLFARAVATSVLHRVHLVPSR